MAGPWIGRVLAAIGIALVLPIVASCASSQVHGVRGYAAGERLPRPGVVLVYDFAVHPSDIDVDKRGPIIVEADAKTSERIQRWLKTRRSNKG